ncbi:MAG: maltose acetyltransferase domain-containing protein, partial [Planctomycetota bacterium]
MRSELDKMLAGEFYDPLDPALVQARDVARDLCQELNATRERDQELRRSIVKRLFGRGGDSVWMQPPFCLPGNVLSLGDASSLRAV